ncbi:MAG: hypothetical protein J1F31_06145 [Erysipelotrichales bacterium]|nr:hypothetical protein [Erysipelotrichales bacterium]
MDEKYENDFSLMVVLKAARKQMITLVYFLISFILIGVAYAFLINPTTYKSSGSIRANKELTKENYQTLVVHLNENLYEKIYMTENTGDTKVISIDEFKAGLTLPEIPTSSSAIFEFSFSSKDKKIVKDVMEKVLNTSIEEFKTIMDTHQFTINQFATDAKASSSTFVKIAAFAAGGIVIGLGVATLKEWRNYTITRKEELEQLDINVFELKYRGGKKHG